MCRAVVNRRNFEFPGSGCSKVFLNATARGTWQAGVLPGSPPDTPDCLPALYERAVPAVSPGRARRTSAGAPGRVPRHGREIGAVKLSRDAIKKIRAEVDWTKPAANAAVEDLFRQLLYRYVTGYLQSGNARLAVYRDTDRPTFVETEFESLVGRMPSLAHYLPEVQRYLLDYPKATLPNSTDFLYWQEARFGLKPTIRISHLVVRQGAEETVVASKMLYSSHYFWTALELRVLVADPARGPGSWFVTVNRSRSDGLEGFMGRIIRRRVHRAARAIRPCSARAATAPHLPRPYRTASRGI